MPKKKRSDFLADAQAKFGDRFDYSKVPEDMQITGRYLIRCKKHDTEFEYKLSSHLTGKGGCPKCNSKLAVMTRENYIERSKAKFGDRYDYSKIPEDIRSSIKYPLICNIHGNEFEYTPNAHLRSNEGGCPGCNRKPAVFGRDAFIEKAIEKYGDKFDYSMIAENMRMRVKEPFKCNIHEITFQTTPDAHLKYDTGGCPECKRIMVIDRTRQMVKTRRPTDGPRKAREETIREFKEAHGDRYDYSMLPEKIKSHDKVPIICPVHGVFHQTPSDHRQGIGCAQCYHDSKRLGKKEFVERANKNHGDRYDYSLVPEQFTMKDKLTIICPIHGEFEQTGTDHSRNDRPAGCPQCSCMARVFNFNNSEYATLYHIEIYNSDGTRRFHKIGITTKGIEFRFRNLNRNKFNYRVIRSVELPLKQAIENEKQMKQEMIDRNICFRIHDLKGTSVGGWTECFRPEDFTPNDKYFVETNGEQN